MKKLFAILLVLTMLSACVGEKPAENIPEVSEKTENTENTSRETQEQITAEMPEKIEIKDEVSYKGENGKFGFHKNGKPVTEPIFDEIIECQGEFKGKKIYEALITEGKRMEFVTDPKKGPHLEECPNTLYYIFDEDGNRINEEPLDDYYVMGPYSYGNGTYDWFLEGTHNGDYYKYSVRKDGTYFLHSKSSAGAYFVLSNRATWEEYIETEYHWGVSQYKHGLTDLDGNVILEDLYMSISTPYPDRIYAYIGWAFQSADEVRLEIYDFEGNLINNEYNYVEQHNTEDYYFLVGYCFGESASEICCDENGDPHEAGWWFVDESGNKLSERFEHISVEKYMTYNGGMWNIEKVTVTDESGTEKEISIEPYKRSFS